MRRQKIRQRWGFDMPSQKYREDVFNLPTKGGEIAERIIRPKRRNK